MVTFHDIGPFQFGGTDIGAIAAENADTGSVAVVVAPFTSSSTASQIFTVTAAIVLSAFTSASAGAIAPTATAAIVLSPFTSASAGTQTVTATAAIVLSPFTSASVAESIEPFFGVGPTSAIVLLPDWVASVTQGASTVGTIDTCQRLVQDLCVVRGDRRSIEFTLKDSAGVVIDLTGFSATLTVDPDADPPDTTTKLFDIPAVIAAPTTGVMVFTPDAVDALQAPDTYFYDIQVINASLLPITVAKGQWEVTADITNAGV